MQETNRIKRYIETYIPVSACNMQCAYCYLSQERHKAISKLKWTPEQVRYALRKERLGGACLINLCAAGETLLLPDIDRLVDELAKEGHFISIVTNGIFKPAFEALAKLSEDTWKHLFFKFSLHVYELRRLGEEETFWKHIKLVKEKGGSFTVELTPDDKYLDIKEDIKVICQEHVGKLCHITIPRDDTKREKPLYSSFDFDTFISKWTEFDSSLLDFKKEIWGKKREEFCYAGDWSVVLDFNDGNIKACYESSSPIQNILDDPDSKIRFEAVGKKCPSCHCFNGHSFLSLGVIPELDAPTYAALRERDGSWLNKEMTEAMSTKLSETNKTYNGVKKASTETKRFMRRVKNKVKRTFRKQ